MSVREVFDEEVQDSLNPYYNGKYSMRGKNILN